jgi:putative ABC transport system ATP-binding protein
MLKNHLDQDILLQTIGLTREYRVGHDIVTALSDVDVAIYKNEFVTIMGPSGCGKSTFLNLIGGLDQPTSGQVFIEGQNLADFTEEELAALRGQKMGFIFQRHDLFPILTARENIEFPMLLAKIPQDERQARSSELLELVNLSDKADFFPDELSGGQQQRVGIARALANASSIMLADEPTGNLDSATAEDVMDSLIALSRSLSLTLIMVTHDPEVAAHADRILYLKDGHLVIGNGKTK